MHDQGEPSSSLTGSSVYLRCGSLGGSSRSIHPGPGAGAEGVELDGQLGGGQLACGCESMNSATRRRRRQQLYTAL